MCNPTHRAGMQFALAPEDISILVPASGASWFLFSGKKWHVPQYVPQGATSFSFKHQTSSSLEFSSGIVCFGLGSSCFHCMLMMGG
jgi:hypothetical protein